MKLHAPAVARNVEPIKAVLAEWLPPTGTVLEVASGSGEHALAFSRAFPGLRWQPSDPDPAALASIDSWRQEEGGPNLLAPVRLDVTAERWPVNRADAVVAINLVHISPWAAALALLRGAAARLPDGGPLVLYGPWQVEGEALEPSNVAFDASLKERNPQWGLREVSAFARAASDLNFVFEEQRRMPANNRMLLFRLERSAG